MTGQNQPDAYPASAPLPKPLQPIFGPGPVKVIPQQYQDLKTAIQQSSIAQKLGLDKVAGPLAFGGVLGQNLLDFAPLGGSEESAIKALAQETDPEAIGAMLRKIGVHPNVADKMAPQIAATTDPSEVKTALDIMKGTQAMHNESVHSDSIAAEQEAVHPTEVKPELSTTTEIPKGNEPNLEVSAPTPKEPYVINAKGKNLTDIRNIISDVKGYVDTTVHDRIEIKNVGKTGETHTILLEQPHVPEPIVHTPIVREETPAPTEIAPKASIAAEAKNADQIGKSALPTLPATPEFRPTHEIKSELNDAVLHQEILNDSMQNHPGRAFIKYKSSASGVLPEIADGSTSKFGKRGDTIGQDAIGQEMSGNGDIDTLNKHLSDYMNMREQKKGVDENVKALRTEYRDARAAEREARTPKLSDEKVDGVPVDKTPATELKQLTSGEDGKSWESIVKGYSKNLPKDKKVNLLDYLSTPEFVLEKLGMQKGADLLQEAKDEYRITLRHEIKTIKDWKARVENDPAARPHAATHLFRYLNGDARYAKSEMTPTEVEVAGEIKTYLKDWADRLHLPTDNRLGNYITHIFDKNAHGDLPSESVFDDPDLSVIMESQPARSVYNPFLEKRLNKPGYKEDVWGALDAYVKRGSRKEAMDPALEEISDMAHKLDDSAYAYVTRLTHRINMRPTEADELVDNLVKEHFGGRFTQRPTAYITGKIRGIFYRGTLGLNVASALRNLSQGANTYAKLGEKYTTIGYFKTLTHLVTRDWSELIDHGVLDEQLNQDQKVGVYKTFLQKIDPALFALFNAAEKINRGAAYYGAKSQALSKGLGPDDAIKFAKRMVRETQFAFGQVDSPVALSSDLIKTVAQMQNYNVKQIEFLTRMAKNKEYGGLVRYSLSSLVFLGTIGKMFGMTIGQLIPSIGIGGSPIGGLASGIAGEFSSSPTTRSSATSQLQRTFATLFPAGAQARKTIQGLEAYSAGKDTTATGKTRYTIPHNPATLMQAALFGKSALPQAQQYYNKLDSKELLPSPAPSASPLSI